MALQGTTVQCTVWTSATQWDACGCTNRIPKILSHYQLITTTGQPTLTQGWQASTAQENAKEREGGREGETERERGREGEGEGEGEREKETQRESYRELERTDHTEALNGVA